MVNQKYEESTIRKIRSALPKEQWYLIRPEELLDYLDEQENTRYKEIKFFNMIAIKYEFNEDLQYSFCVLPIKIDGLDGTYRFSDYRFNYIPKKAKNEGISQNKELKLAKAALTHLHQAINALYLSFLSYDILAQEIYTIMGLNLNELKKKQGLDYTFNGKSFIIDIYPIFIVKNPAETRIKISNDFYTGSMHNISKFNTARFIYFPRFNMRIITRDQLKFLFKYIEKKEKLMLKQYTKLEVPMKTFQTNKIDLIFGSMVVLIGLIDIALVFATPDINLTRFIIISLIPLFGLLIGYLISKFIYNKRTTKSKKLKKIRIIEPIKFIPEFSSKPIFEILEKLDGLEMRRQLIHEHFVFWNSDPLAIKYINNFNQYMNLIKNRSIEDKNRNKILINGLLKYLGKKSRSEFKRSIPDRRTGQLYKLYLETQIDINEILGLKPDSIKKQIQDFEKDQNYYGLINLFMLVNIRKFMKVLINCKMIKNYAVYANKRLSEVIINLNNEDRTFIDSYLVQRIKDWEYLLLHKKTATLKKFNDFALLSNLIYSKYKEFSEYYRLKNTSVSNKDISKKDISKKNVNIPIKSNDLKVEHSPVKGAEMKLLSMDEDFLKRFITGNLE
ncbi:MAG: hypothetical protein GF364_16345 [Candidatus Lokiarchaeota archaeon]|nr:hypothetical protein [Candidatus Lokiarchaeota archaeon]